MKYKNILLTGASGKLGQAIASSQYFSSLITPSRQDLDITKPAAIKRFFGSNNIDAIIHCAALARMSECESNPDKATLVNTIGTANLVIEVLKKESKTKQSIRFMHISTDGVYSGTKGNYSEQDETIPYNHYGWTKLGAECAVNLLSNFCIMRTSFFDPENIKFKDSAIDAYSSKVPIKYLVKSIAIMLEHDFVGTINIGGERKSDYDRYKEFKPSLKPCKLKGILKSLPFAMAYDSSMNVSLWKKVQLSSKGKQSYQ